jgi:hypothetical protein
MRLRQYRPPCRRNAGENIEHDSLTALTWPQGRLVSARSSDCSLRVGGKRKLRRKPIIPRQHLASSASPRPPAGSPMLPEHCPRDNLRGSTSGHCRTAKDRSPHPEASSRRSVAKQGQVPPGGHPAGAAHQALRARAKAGGLAPPSRLSCRPAQQSCGDLALVGAGKKRIVGPKLQDSSGPP